MAGTESAAKVVESASEDHDPDFLDEPADIRCASRWMMMKEVITVIKTLPENVQHRVNALKHLQEGKYQELCQPLGDRRKAIITGESELKVGEAEWKVESEDEVDVEVTERFKRMALNLKNQHSKIIKDAQGIPAFWLTVFKNTQTMADMIQPHDKQFLTHLTKVDIVCKTDPMSYVLEFHFSLSETAILYYTGEVMDEDDDDERPQPAKNQKQVEDAQNPVESQQQ
ncbi:hypothetical protein pipiens_016594 [Culex pipiens pipiens]|uniref:Nucleosome assembly protein n=1 Tax=Culex pipiens pipiens TaxID=38569 RepID=A0ABD1CKQ2_CULPP